MAKRIKQLILMGAVGYAIYFLLAYHIIFIGKSVSILKKNELTLTDTFVNPGNRKEILYKGIETFLRNESLRDAGIGELLIEKGLITPEELRKAEDKVDYGE